MPCGQQYPVGVVQRFLAMVLHCGASLRCAASVLELFGSAAGPGRVAPHASTGRWWLLRVGLAALLRAKVVAADWVWLVDHSIQIGQCKCLVILGIRLSELPEGRPLVHRDLEPIALVPMKSSTKETVAACLEDAVSRTGVPRAILDDHGADLHGGVEIFRQAHPETNELYDITHKAACLLKGRLEGDERWKSYASQLGKTKFALQQTELAFLTPPSQRSKARFMNVGVLVGWGRKTLALVDDPSGLERSGVTAERLQSKLGWLAEYREDLKRWSAFQQVIDGALAFVRCRGLYLGAGFDIAAALPVASGAAAELRDELIAFVRGEALKARLGERLPGTTEVLESCFGKLKATRGWAVQERLHRVGAQSGSDGLAVDGREPCRGAAQCRVRDVLAWCHKMLGESVQSQRERAYSQVPSATKPG